MMNSKAAIGFGKIKIVSFFPYLEDIQDLDIATQFQQSDNNEMIITDLHIFNQFRVPYALQLKLNNAYNGKSNMHMVLEK